MVRRQHHCLHDVSHGGRTDDIPNDNIHPNSGLHAITPTVSETPHDGTLGSGCTDCHTMPTIAPASSHIDGTAVADSAANTDRGLWDDYQEAATGSCVSTGGQNEIGAGGCHDGPGEVGNWERIWSTTAANSDGTECANCHGGPEGTSWTYDGTQAGSVEHDKDWDTGQSSADGAEVIGNHSANNDQTDQCNICHVYADTPYNASPIGWVGAGTGTYHGNDNIDMNSTLSYNGRTSTVRRTVTSRPGATPITTWRIRVGR